MAYATLRQLKSALAIGSTDTLDDDTLQLALDSASEQIDAYCGRTFTAAGTASTRYYPAFKVDQVEVDDFTGPIVTFAYAPQRDGNYSETITAANLATLPTNGIADGMTWPFTAIRVLDYTTLPISRNGEPTVAVTAAWGFGYVPNAVVRACIAQASRLHARNLSPYGVAGFGDMGVVRIQQGLDVDVQMLLAPYRKLRGAA